MKIYELWWHWFPSAMHGSVICLTDPNNTQKNTYTDIRRFPCEKFQTFLYAATFTLSLITFALFFEPEYAFEETIPALSIACLSFLALGLPRFIEFRKISTSIQDSDVLRNPGQHGRRELLIIGLGVAFFSLAILGPFILAFITTPAVWMGAVLGMIAGMSSSQLAFALYTQRWEKNNHVKLYRYVVWFRDERNRKTVIEYGVRSE